MIGPIHSFGIRSIPPCGDCHDDGTCSMNCSPASFPKAIAAATDAVLAYRPKPKSEPAKARKRLAAKNAKKGR
jgi:hypothetical protein